MTYFVPVNKNILTNKFRFEEIGTSIDQIDEEDNEDQSSPSNGIIRSIRKKKTPKEHVTPPPPDIIPFFLLLFISRYLIMKWRK